MPGKCTFSENWTSHVAYKDWILRDSSSQHKARCRLCQKSFDCSNMGESALKSHMGGRKHKELAALIAERSAPITQFMSSNAASSSSSDKPGPLTSRGVDSSPSVRDASAETPSSSASLKETLVSSYVAKEETLKAEFVGLCIRSKNTIPFTQTKGLTKFSKTCLVTVQLLRSFPAVRKSAVI